MRHAVIFFVSVALLTGCAVRQISMVMEYDKATSHEYFKSNFFSPTENLDPIEGLWSWDTDIRIPVDFAHEVAIVKKDKIINQLMLVDGDETTKNLDAYDYLGITVFSKYDMQSQVTPGTIKLRLNKEGRNYYIGQYTAAGDNRRHPPEGPGLVNVEVKIRGKVIEFHHANFGMGTVTTGIKSYPKSKTYLSSDESTSDIDISGTGFFINSDGYVITNYHVVDGCENHKVVNKSDNFKAKIVAKDESLDLAILQVESSGNFHLDISKKPAIKLQDIIAVGFPFGKYLNDDLKYTSGIVSSLKGPGDNSNLIQIDAALNFGNSGGPIVDKNTGNVVAVAVGMIRNETIESINYGIKNTALINFLDTNSVSYDVNSSSRSLERSELSKKLESSTVYVGCS